MMCLPPSMSYQHRNGASLRHVVDNASVVSEQRRPGGASRMLRALGLDSRPAAPRRRTPYRLAVLDYSSVHMSFPPLKVPPDKRL